MKAHRRGTPRLTWFKLAVCICLAAMAASLFTPYPAQIIRALKGEPEQAPPGFPGPIRRMNPSLRNSPDRKSLRPPLLHPFPERNLKIHG